jgi:4-hydroxybenzoate polyprenyltransferase
VAYLIGIVFVAFCLIVEHWLARRRSMNWVQNAFFRLNALVSIVFLAVTAIEVVFPFFRLK